MPLRQTPLKYVPMTIDMDKSYWELFKETKVFSFCLRILKVFHVNPRESTHKRWFRGGDVLPLPEIWKILLMLSTESLSNQEKYQEAAERFYLLNCLYGRRWLLEVKSKQPHDLLVEIAQILYQCNKNFDISLLDQVESHKPFDQLTIDYELLSSPETWNSLPRVWF